MHGRVLCVFSAAFVIGLSISFGGLFAHAQGAVQLTDTRRAELQTQLDQINAQIEVQKKILSGKQSERVSLERDVAILDAQIAKTKLAIKARDLTIQGLTSDIQNKEDTIFGLNSKLNAELESMEAIMRQKNQLDTTPLALAVLSSQSLSDFFSDLDTFDSINKAMQASFVEIRDTKEATQAQKDDLEDKREEETQLRQVQQLQQRQLLAKEAEKNSILKETKGQEKAYQELIAANQKTAAQIRSALFELSGSAAIPFGKALEYALLAEKHTGIRPAFLLGIIAEESNLGENVGTGSWQVDMHKTRDVPVFEKIAASLGLNPNTLPVSKKPWYGWGGAMGLAQFIPSTWAIYAGYPKPSYNYEASEDRVGKLTGNYPPSPWNPKDAFMASALYLTDSGAAKKTGRDEFIAAMCYLAGCGNASKKSLQFYGDQVLCLELKYQKDIDIILGTNDADSMRADTLYYGQC